MPDSGGSVPCHQGHMRTYSTVEDTQDLNHDSGTWMEVSSGGGRALEDPFDSQPLRNQQVRGHGQFVTVVAVEKDDQGGGSSDRDDEKRGTRCIVESSSTLTCHARQPTTQPVPKAAPRGFVTVVAVGSDTNLQVNHSGGTITANLKLHLTPQDQEVIGDGDEAESDYVNQEMIERERKASSERRTEATAEGFTPSTIPDQVVVYRLPGERLGLGLKFDGGMGSRECVKRLFIQSVAPDSPAARAAVPWGELQPGDQILNIEGCSVSSMTRVQCVSFLKDAAMKITIGVLKGNGVLPEFENSPPEGQEYIRHSQDQDECFDSSCPPPLIVGEMRKRVPPPPLPPRSRQRKSPARPPKDPQPVPPPPSGFQDMEGEAPLVRHHQRSSSLDDGEDRESALQRWREMILARRSRPGDLEELMEDLEFHHPLAWIARRVEDSLDGDMPPVPAFYHDLVGEEDAMGPCESESDETNSSVSTVIDRLSLSSSTTVSRNSSFNATADTSRFDLARALSPFEQLEKELETENLSEVPLTSPNTAPRDEVSVAPPIDRTTKPPSLETADSEVEVPASGSTRKGSTGKIKMRSSIKPFFSLKGRSFSWQQGKTHESGLNRAVGRAENFLSIKRSGKRPAPPPPPRSVDTGTSQTNTAVTVISNMNTGEYQNVDSALEDSDYIDLVAEAAKQGIVGPVNVGSQRKDDESAADQSLDSPEYSVIADSPDGEEVEKLSSKGIYAEIDEETNESNRISDKDSNKGSEGVSVTSAVQDHEYIELLSAAEAECQTVDNSEISGKGDKCEKDLVHRSSTMEIEAQVHREASDGDDSTDVGSEEHQDEKSTEEEEKITSECTENIYEGEFISGSDDSDVNDSDDCEGDDDDEEEDEEGSYILEPDLYDDSEGFLSCSSPKISPPILPPRVLKLPSLVISEANEMGVYEDLYEAYSSIDDGPVEIPLDRGLRETRGLPSVPEEDSGDQDDTMEEEDPYTLYDDVEEDSKEDEPEGHEEESSDASTLKPHENDVSTTTQDVTEEGDACTPAMVSPEDSDAERQNRTISQGYRAKRLRRDLGELIRREMNLEDDVTVEVEEEEEVENLVECANEEELLLVMRALRQDQPGDKLRWLRDDSDEEDDDKDEEDDDDDDDDAAEGGGHMRKGGGTEGEDEGGKGEDETDRKGGREREGGSGPPAREKQREMQEGKMKKGQEDGEGEEGGEGGKPLSDPPSTALSSSSSSSSASRGQSSAEDREVVWARALPDPQGECGSQTTPYAPPPPSTAPPVPRAPPQTPLDQGETPLWDAHSVAAAAAATLRHVASSSSSVSSSSSSSSFALNSSSLPQGSGRHPHNITSSLTSTSTSSKSSFSSSPSKPPPTQSKSFDDKSRSLQKSSLQSSLQRSSLQSSEEYEVEAFEESEAILEARDPECQASVKALLACQGSAAVGEVIAAANNALQCSPEVTSDSATRSIDASATSGDSAMVARTDTNEAGKATPCPDDLQPLTPLQIKQEVGEAYVPQRALVTASSTPEKSGGASSSSEVPLDSSSSAIPPERGGEEDRSGDDSPKPPNYATHPGCKDSADIENPFVEGSPAEGSSTPLLKEAEEKQDVQEDPQSGAVEEREEETAEEEEGKEELEGATAEEEPPSQEESHLYETGGGGSVSVSSCEHRYTSSGGAPPPYSRLPPDGHEFPSSYAEGLPDKLSRYARYSRLAMELDSPGSPTSPPASANSTPRTRSAPGTPLGPPPPIPRSSPTSAKNFTSEKSLDMGGKWTGGDERKTRENTPTRGRWRRQDERSERSVRDKIAMFSTDGPDQPHPKTRKLDKVDDEVMMKRAFTEDDVRLENSSNSNNDSSSNGSRSLSKTSAFSSMINVSTTEPKDSIKMSAASSEADIRQDMPPIPRQNEIKEEKRKEESSSGSTGLHSRSQSLNDIGRTSLTKRHSVGAYDRPSVYQYGIEKPEERERRTSLTNLIEQRRKSVSKLRGLVIPESRNGDGEKAAIDLPKISSVPPSSNLKTMSLPREGQRSPRLYKADSVSSIDSCESNTSRQSSLIAPPWKGHNNSTSTLPKYSPAFKRKNMAVFNKCDNLPPLSGRTHSTRSASPTSDLSQASPVPPAHTPTPPRSLETITTPNSENSFDYCDGRYSSEKHGFNKIPLSQKSSLDSRLSRAEDSDNDSAVSSTQSSFSQGMSPPSSPMPEQDEQEDRRYRSYRSRLSPQSSFDDQEAARRVLKRGSIEAENRRNVLNSARCSSGRSSDEQLTPEIIRKFSTEKTEENGKFPKRLDSELRDGPKTLGLRRHPSASSTSSTTSSRRSSHDSSRRNSRDSVIHVSKHDEKVSAEPVYFDKEGEMYKESQVKVAYLNEIMDDFEQLNDGNSDEVIAEIQMSSSRRVVENPEFLNSPTSPSKSSGRKSERWAALEMKYGLSNADNDIETKIQRSRRASDSTSPDRTRKKSNGFKALAERWQQRAEEETTTPQPQLVRRESTSRLEMPARPNRLYDDRSSISSTLERPSRPSRLCDDNSELDSARPSRPTCLYSESTQSPGNNNSSESRSSGLDIPKADVPDRKLSMPEYGNSGIKLRERREGNNGGAPSRPTSLIEGGDNEVMNSHYLTAGGPLSPSVSTDSRDDLYTPEDSLSRTGSKEVLDAFSRPKTTVGVSMPRSGASNTPKISDIMRAFERHDLGKRGTLGNGNSHPRMSSLDSTNSDDGSQGAHYGSVTSLASGQRDQYGSITSLASSTSLISPQELAQLIEEANQSLEESGTPSHEILVVVLHREIVGHGSIGITLAGGADYEAKEITVHKVIPGSLADRDGRIQRGDRVLSINGKNLRGVTHREALNILKSPRPEVVLVLSRSRSVTPQESNLTEDGNFTHRPLINHVTSPRPPKILESPMDSKSLFSDAEAIMTPRGPPLTITLMKDGAGLGFSLEGGKDSPLGDRPLTIKKIFSGGAADKGGVLKVGDELVSVNAVDVTGMARIEAWNFLKKLPDGTVSLVLRKKLEDSQSKSEE